MADNKKLIEFLGDTVDYLGLYSPDKNGMIRTGFTLNQKAMLTEIKGILEKENRVLQTIEDGKLYMGEPDWKQHDLMTENELRTEVIKLRACVVRMRRQQAQPDEELVEKFVRKIQKLWDEDSLSLYVKDEVLEFVTEIRKLLQSRNMGRE